MNKTEILALIYTEYHSFCPIYLPQLMLQHPQILVLCLLYLK